MPGGVRGGPRRHVCSQRVHRAPAETHAASDPRPPPSRGPIPSPAHGNPSANATAPESGVSHVTAALNPTPHLMRKNPRGVKGRRLCFLNPASGERRGAAFATEIAPFREHLRVCAAHAGGRSPLCKVAGPTHRVLVAQLSASPHFRRPRSAAPSAGGDGSLLRTLTDLNEFPSSAQSTERRAHLEH